MKSKKKKQVQLFKPRTEREARALEAIHWLLVAVSDQGEEIKALKDELRNCQALKDYHQQMDKWRVVTRAKEKEHEKNLLKIKGKYGLEKIQQRAEQRRDLIWQFIQSDPKHKNMTPAKIKIAMQLDASVGTIREDLKVMLKTRRVLRA